MKMRERARVAARRHATHRLCVVKYGRHGLLAMLGGRKISFVVASRDDSSLDSASRGPLFIPPWHAEFALPADRESVLRQTPTAITRFDSVSLPKGNLYGAQLFQQRAQLGGIGLEDRSTRAKVVQAELKAHHIHVPLVRTGLDPEHGAVKSVSAEYLGLVDTPSPLLTAQPLTSAQVHAQSSATVAGKLREPVHATLLAQATYELMNEASGNKERRSAILSWSEKIAGVDEERDRWYQGVKAARSRMSQILVLYQKASPAEKASLLAEHQELEKVVGGPWKRPDDDLFLYEVEIRQLLDTAKQRYSTQLANYEILGPDFYPEGPPLPL